LAAVLGITAGTAQAAALSKPYLIDSDAQAGPITIGHTNLPQATSALRNRGRRVVRHRPNLCLVTWPRIGLTVNFGLVGNDSRDRCKAGAALVVTITSRGPWKTTAGLRIGDSVAQLQRLYPRATAHLADLGQAGYWLVTRRLCKEVGGQPYAGLLARVHKDRVSAFVASAGVCD
jgi:hypothetical protein